MDLKSTTDIWFASYLRHNGYEVKDYEIINRSKGKFFFDLSQDKWKEMRLKFDGSETSKIKMHQISLKDLLH